ncbi:MAG: arsenite methyltransferase [Candidatus Hydrogenedentes bacterium]|nr:arsenite methyltransferase [Candidatus Hydrogenedentota bacterium]
MQATEIHEEVRKRYGAIAEKSTGCCGGCCDSTVAADIAEAVGYSPEEVAAAPEGANLGLGCGNPVALASLQPGETVLDLGSGAGFDCFLAARSVGPEGRVIGVDMTPEMLARARANAVSGGYDNVEFREGNIEALPVESASVDVLISNCVINLSPDKDQVFREAFRVLRPGGRLFVSDLMLLRPLPRLLRRSMTLYAGCIAGALVKDDYLASMRRAGLSEVRILNEQAYTLEVLENDPTLRPIVRLVRLVPPLRRYAESVVSVKVSARKAGPV